MIKLKDKIYYINKLKKDKGSDKGKDKGVITKGIEEKQMGDISNQILDANFQEQLNKSYNNYPSRYDEKKKKIDRAADVKNENYVDLDNESFESASFDIYNPGNSIETLESSELKEMID